MWHQLRKMAKNIMYHGSMEQGLKIIVPKKSVTSHSQKAKNERIVYVTDDKAYASGFVFPWSEKDGFEFGRVGEDDWTLEIPKRHVDRLKKPCSIYEVEGDFTKLNTDTPEWVSHEDVKVVREDAYDSVEECLIKNGVKIIID